MLSIQKLKEPGVIETFGYYGSTFAACKEAVNITDGPPEKMYYMLGAQREYTPLGQTSTVTVAMCALMRPCDSGGHEYLFGFRDAKIVIKSGAYEFVFRLLRLGFWKNGQNFLSDNKVFTAEDPSRAIANIAARRHLTVQGIASIEIPKVAKNVSASVQLDGKLNIDLDPRYVQNLMLVFLTVRPCKG
jgi:hypothetical protein